MNIDDVAKVVEVTRTQIAPQVLKCLVDVEILVCADVASAVAEIRSEFDEDPFAGEGEGMPPTCKAVFVGEPMNVEEDDDDTEIVEYPNGVIALVASNLENPEEVHIAFLHEVAHALDFDEDEVSQLGLAGHGGADDAKDDKQAAG